MEHSFCVPFCLMLDMSGMPFLCPICPFCLFCHTGMAHGKSTYASAICAVFPKNVTCLGCVTFVTFCGVTLYALHFDPQDSLLCLPYRPIPLESVTSPAFHVVLHLLHVTFQIRPPGFKSRFFKRVPKGSSKRGSRPRVTASIKKDGFCHLF